MLLKIAFVLVAASFIIKNEVNPASLQDFHKLVNETTIKCDAEYDYDAKCYQACLYKGVKLINSKGLFEVSTPTNWDNLYAREYPDMVKARSIVKDCEYVNQKPVTDGTEGCERAKLLADCIATLAAKLKK